MVLHNLHNGLFWEWGNAAYHSTMKRIPAALWAARDTRSGMETKFCLCPQSKGESSTQGRKSYFSDNSSLTVSGTPYLCSSTAISRGVSCPFADSTYSTFAVRFSRS